MEPARVRSLKRCWGLVTALIVSVAAPIALAQTTYPYGWPEPQAGAGNAPYGPGNTLLGTGPGNMQLDRGPGNTLLGTGPGNMLLGTGPGSALLGTGSGNMLLGTGPGSTLLGPGTGSTTLGGNTPYPSGVYVVPCPYTTGDGSQDNSAGACGGF